ncbi:MAG: hypothetical protein CBE24_07300 [bacterium TMED264]|nr:MAG: hypothetical protein CBE24_07300 [bacterium TMED264]|tara:strand:- start:244 stop:504 length:261 start_codon:yes stop_codon:yes gene_type:complete
MRKEKLYIEFENLAEKLGLRIIKGRGDFQGGSCIIKNEQVIVVNKRKPLEQKLKTLASCFNKIDLNGIYIIPALRAYIEDSNTLEL